MRLLTHKYLFFILLSLSLLNSTNARASLGSWISKNTSINLQYAGFAGDISAGVTLHWTQKFYTEFLYGQSEVEGEKPIKQISSKIIYSPWLYQLNNKQSWRIFYTGLFLTYTNDDRFFIESPSPFPEGNYYENNALRSGIVFGSSWILKPAPHQRIELYVEVVTLDTLLVAYYNNPEYFSMKELFGAGAGIKFHF